MKQVKIKNIVFGEGRPKICLPLTGKTKEELLEETKALNGLTYDVIEWRMDNLIGLCVEDNVAQTAKFLRECLGDAVILATCRTKKEGGYADITTDEYIEVNKKVCRSGAVDLIDVEAFTGDDEVLRMINNAHEYGVKVVLSNHDFDKTPPKDEIVNRITFMEKLGADIAKIALMPQNKRDVLVLLSATEEASRCSDIPLITMSMGKMGVVSRLCGEVFGSSLTFGAAKNASAPGQINARDLETVLSIIHESI